MSGWGLGKVHKQEARQVKRPWGRDWTTCLQRRKVGVTGAAKPETRWELMTLHCIWCQGRHCVCMPTHSRCSIRAGCTNCTLWTASIWESVCCHFVPSLLPRKFRQLLMSRKPPSASPHQHCFDVLTTLNEDPNESLKMASLGWEQNSLHKQMSKTTRRLAREQTLSPSSSLCRAGRSFPPNAGASLSACISLGCDSPARRTTRLGSYYHMKLWV